MFEEKPDGSLRLIEGEEEEAILELETIWDMHDLALELHGMAPPPSPPPSPKLAYKNWHKLPVWLLSDDDDDDD